MHRTSLPFFAGIAAASFFAVQAIALESARSVGETRAGSGDVRKLSSRHLVLYTDVPAHPQIDRLPHIFDQAVPQWAQYFGVPDAKTADWRAEAYLIGDRRRFEALGLMPAGHKEFVNGISIGSRLWLYDQPTDYYRRHLLLHEGTHVFMNAMLGGCGPGWYMEGTAELLATHGLDEKTDQLTLRIMPRDRGEVPMLGRIKLIRDAFDAGRVLGFPEVLQIDNRQQLGNEAYAWCWSAAKFLDSHPRYYERFRDLKHRVTDEKFNDTVRRDYEHDWDDLTAEWQAFVATLEHGFDFERMAIDFRRGQPLGPAPHRVSIAADRGWQSSGVWLEAGTPYRVSASGRYQIAVEEKDGVTRPWPCEPGGVTIEYHNGNPLGMLLGAIDARLDRPIAIGLSSTIEPTASGTLYLRVNDSPARLGDNRGTLMVTIEAIRQ